jgi:hypothetical protein
MERRSLAALAVAALFVSAVAWVLLSDSQGDDSYDRVARTWIDGEDPELAGSAATKADVVATDNDAAARESAAPDVEPLETAPSEEAGAGAATELSVVDLVVPGIELRRQRSRTRTAELEIEFTGTLFDARVFPTWITLVDGAHARTRRVVCIDRAHRPRVRFDGLSGSVAVSIEFTDAAPIEVTYANGGISRRLVIDLDRCQRALLVEARFAVAPTRDRLATAASLNTSEEARLFGGDVERTVWFALAEGRGTPLASLGLSALDDVLDVVASRPVASLFLPLTDDGDTYTSGDATVVVGRGWREDLLVPLTGWPRLMNVKVEPAVDAFRGAYTRTSVVNLEVLEYRANKGFEVIFEIDLPSSGAAPRELEIVGYGLGRADGAPSFVRTALPIAYDAHTPTARCSLDFANFVVPLRVMLRVDGCRPQFVDGHEFPSGFQQRLEFVTGSGGIVLARYENERMRRDSAVPAHFDVRWNDTIERLDALGFAEFASDSSANFEVELVEPDAANRNDRLSTSITADSRVLAPGVVELVIDAY